MNEDTNMKAVEEQVSVEAQLRIDLQTLDETYSVWHQFPNKDDFKRFQEAHETINDNSQGNLHVLFAIIDAERAESARLRKENEQLQSDLGHAKAQIQWLEDKWVKL